MQQRAGMVVRAHGPRRIGVAASPGEDRRAVDDDIAAADQAGMARQVDQRPPRASRAGGAPACAGALALLGRTGHRTWPAASPGSPQASASAGQATNQSCTSW